MVGQNLKAVVQLGGSVDSSFQKIGSEFDKTMGQATKTVKGLEREQNTLTRAIEKSTKAAAEADKLDQMQAESLQNIQRLMAERQNLTRTINGQTSAIRRLDKALESTDDPAEVQRLTAEREQLNASLDDERKKRDRVTAEIKSNEKAQKQYAKEAKGIRDNIQDADELSGRLNDVSGELKDAKRNADGLSKAGKLGGTFRTIGAGAAYAGAAVGGLVAAMGGLMTMTNEQTAEMVGLAQAYDMNVEQFAAWGGVAKQAGLEMDTVGDMVEELSNKFGEFKALGEQSSVADVFGALGIEQAMLDGMETADQFEFIMNRLQQVGDKQQAASLADMLFGGEGNKITTYIRNTGKSIDELLERQRDLNQLTNEGGAGAQKYGYAFKNLKTVVTSSWQEISGIVGGELAGEIDTLGDSIAGFVREHKDEIVVAIKGLITAAGDAVNVVWELGKTVNSVVQTFGGWETVGAVVAGMLAGKLVVGIASVVSTGLSMIKMLGAAKVGMAGFNVVMAANPIGAVAAAIGLLVTGGILLYQNWDKITAWFGEKLPWIGDLFEGVWDGIKTVFSWTPLGMVVNNWSPIMDFFSGLFDGIGKIISDRIAVIKNTFDTVKGWVGKLKFWESDDDEKVPDQSVVQPVRSNVVRPNIDSWRQRDLDARREEVRERNRSRVNGARSERLAGDSGLSVVQPLSRSESVVREREVQADKSVPELEAPVSRGADVIAKAEMGSRGTTVNQTVGNIEIHAAPGQSPQEVARAVHEELRGTRNSALYDLPEVG